MCPELLDKNTTCMPKGYTVRVYLIQEPSVPRDISYPIDVISLHIRD